MKAVAGYAPYGWRAKIGLIIPSTNTINEVEFCRLAPRGVTIHTARATSTGEFSEAYFQRLREAGMHGADDLATAEVDVIAYGCTSGSIVQPLDEIVSGIGTRAGVPAIATAGAVIAALRALGISRVAVATPYVDFINEAERKFLALHRFEVTSLHGLGLGGTEAERRAIGRVPPEHVYRMARQVDRPEAQAIFISCTNLATLDVIAAIETDLGKPVVTSNQACFWNCLRLAGIPDRIEGYGRLLSECTNPIAGSPHA
ncbi:decarboxylase [Roseomonas hellenica]|uniref:Decarboxylase n=1 Tax=Plastoroseomonas hellenica TaxID=2687306 RepID=A0ABS5F4U5_9PROT|nr:aspartate/glutamate racemase family protein [Plastoroseomonas hellenica]MBR0667580.1 decarboxylase [Plastoroseomonas hellenica]